MFNNFVGSMDTHVDIEIRYNYSVYFKGPNIVIKKCREPTQFIKIINLWKWKKLSVEFDENNQAIGENATKFIWFLGQTVRSRSWPLKVDGWKEIEDNKIDHIWDIILVRIN